jgi:hypothetical protein
MLVLFSEFLYLQFFLNVLLIFFYYSKCFCVYWFLSSSNSAIPIIVLKINFCSFYLIIVFSSRYPGFDTIEKVLYTVTL